MTNGNKTGDLQSRYEFNSTWADRIARLIIVGLIVDIVAAFILGKSWLEIALNIIANLLIIAGVWGELRFSRRAKEAGDGIVAEAKARATEAQLELERLKKPRWLSSEARQRISDALRQFAGVEFDIAVQSADPEAEAFFPIIEKVLKDAGWQQIDWDGGGLILFRTELPKAGVISKVGIVVGTYANHAIKLASPIAAFVSALQAEKVEASAMSNIDVPNNNPAAIHVLIGKKP